MTHRAGKSREPGPIEPSHRRFDGWFDGSDAESRGFDRLRQHGLEPRRCRQEFEPERLGFVVHGRQVEHQARPRPVDEDVGLPVEHAQQRAVTQLAEAVDGDSTDRARSVVDARALVAIESGGSTMTPARSASVGGSAACAARARCRVDQPSTASSTGVRSRRSTVPSSADTSAA